MAVQPFRLIESRHEWDSVAKLAPGVYHRISWTLMSVARIRRQIRVPVTCGYARVWAGDTLIGCPLIRVGGKTRAVWFNTPRAAPVVLAGEPVDPHAALTAASPEPVAVYDDSDADASIVRVARSATSAASASRTRRAVTRGDLPAVYGLPAGQRSWFVELTAGDWLDELAAVCRASSWDTLIREHHDAGGVPVGWTVHADGHLVAALHVGRPIIGWQARRDVSPPPLPSRHERRPDRRKTPEPDDERGRPDPVPQR